MTERATHPLLAFNVLVGIIDRLRKYLAATKEVQLPADTDRIVERIDIGAGFGKMGYTSALCVTSPNGKRYAFAVGNRFGGSDGYSYEHDLAMVPVLTATDAPEADLVAEIVRTLTEERGEPALLRADDENYLAFNIIHPQDLGAGHTGLKAVRTEEENIKRDEGRYDYRYTSRTPEIIFEELCRLLEIPVR